MDFNRPTRHSRANQKTQTRLILATVFLIGIMVLFWYNLKEYQVEEKEKSLDVKDYLPEARQGVVYNKPFFSLSYVEKYEIPEWVAYQLTVDMLNSKKFPRDQDFNPDTGIKDGSAHYHDYKQSGYRRGHLVPSADMAWNKDAMDATFLLSNIAPMKQEFNDGVWLELEHNVRDWARKHKAIKVITGPVFTDSLDVIGDNDVLVPRYFYKAVFTVVDTVPMVVGFLFDQTVDTDARLDHFIVPVDSIEKVTGLDLFANLYGDWDREIELEKVARNNEQQWPFNEKWYQERMELETKR